MFAFNKAICLCHKKLNGLRTDARSLAGEKLKAVGNPFLWPRNRKSFVWSQAHASDAARYWASAEQTQRITLLPFECHLLVTQREPGAYRWHWALRIFSTWIKGNPFVLSLHHRTRSAASCLFCPTQCLTHYCERAVGAIGKWTEVSCYLLFFLNNRTALSWFLLICQYKWLCALHFTEFFFLLSIYKQWKGWGFHWENRLQIPQVRTSFECIL